MRRITRKGGVSVLAGGKRTRVYVLCGLLAVTIAHGQTLEELKTTYNEQVRVLDANYAAQVSAAKEQFKAKVVLLRDHLKKEGDLQAYLAVETELEKLDASTTSDQVASPHVRKLLLRYEKEKNEVDQRLLVLRRKLNLQYQERLKERIKVLMLADRIEDAELAQTELDLILGMTIISSAGVDKVQRVGTPNHGATHQPTRTTTNGLIVSEKLQESIIGGIGHLRYQNGKLRVANRKRKGAWIDLSIVNSDMKNSLILAERHIQYENGKLRVAYGSKKGAWIDLSIVNSDMQDSVLPSIGYHIQYQNGKLRVAYNPEGSPNKQGAWIRIRE